LKRNLKLQAAIDYLVSYGIVIIVLVVAIAAISSIILTQPGTPSCTAPPGFSCAYLAINKSGVLEAKISQALGTQITLNGAACSALQNSSGDNPQYGNPRVGNILSAYPLNYGTLIPGNSMYSGSSYIFYVYCYGPGGQVATGTLGSQFNGYLWINYTIPGYKKSQVQKVAFFTAEYS